MISASSMSQLLSQMCRDVLFFGDKSAPRGHRIMEAVNASYCLEDPYDRIARNPARKFSLQYLKAELLWYISRDPSVGFIAPYASTWGKIADEFGKANSNYGQYAFHPKQYKWVVSSLKADKDSRQAIINFNQPKHKYAGNKDFVCTISAQYLIRKNKLHAITNVRSNDVIYGATYDVPFFTLLQEVFLEELKPAYPGLEMGDYFHNVASLHIYERHWEMAEKIAGEKRLDPAVEMPRVDAEFLSDLQYANLPEATANSALMQWLKAL